MPEQRISFDEAVQWARAIGGRVGYVLMADDPFVCLNLDNALTPAGTPRDWAAKILKHFPDTYTEISPSGQGCHIWIQATDGLESRLTKATWVPRTWERAQVCEVYSQNKFIIVTGDVYADRPCVIANRQVEFDRFVADLLLPAS